MLDRPPCWLLLLLLAVAVAAPPWFIGLPGPPEDSLSVPLDGGLLGPIPTPIGTGAIGASFGGADAGSGGAACCFFAFFSPVSGLKLPTTICSCKHGG
jgi:hypothetical protein